MPLQQARKRRDEARQLLAAGKDPSAERQAEKETQQSNGLTFETLAREWHAYRAPRWAKSTADKTAAYLASDLLPAQGKRPVKAITRPELVDPLRRIEDRGAHNVATDLDVVAAHAPATRHHPHVTFAELPELLGKIEGASINVLTRHAIRLLVLTGVRPGELRAAPWAEFDLEAAVWTIPKERMKARRPHVVPLPRQAVAILRQLQEITGCYALVFAGRNNSARPMSENTVNKALADAGYRGRQIGHGFRHLLSTELNSRGYNRD